MSAPTPVSVPEHKRRKGRCVLLTTAPAGRKGHPEYRGPYDSPGAAKSRGQDLERARVIGYNWWVFPLSPP